MSVHYVPAKRPPTPDVLGAVLEAKVERELIPLSKIRNDGGTQMRAGLDATTVQEYADVLYVQERTRDWPFPPIVVYYDGTDYWLADGFHRVAAAQKLVPGDTTRQIPADVRAGSRRDAILYAAGANAAHGLRRTNADKRRAVEVLLRDTEWVKWSDSEIARKCAVSSEMVRLVRKSIFQNLEDSTRDSADEGGQQTRTVTRGGTTYTQKTANIGASQPQYAPVWKLEYEVREVCAQFYDADDQRHTLSDMRAAAKLAVGGFWDRCKVAIDATTDITAWRVSDLRQAINNVAAQMEAQASTGSRTDIGEPTIEVVSTADIRRQAAPVAEVLDADLFADAERTLIASLKPGEMKGRFTWRGAYWVAVGGVYGGNANPPQLDELHCVRIHPAGEDIAPGVRIGRYTTAAYLPGTELHHGGSTVRIGAQWLVVKRQRQAAQAATALADLPVLATTATDAPARLEPAAPIPVMLLKGKLRRWLGERYNAYFTYQMLNNWMQQASLTDLEAFTATLPAGWTQDALNQAIQELHAHFAPDEDDAPAEPVISLDELEMVSSVTGPTGWTDPAPEHELDSYDEESPTVAARRMNKLHTLKVRFAETIDLLEDFGELTGRHIATLAVGRELANLIDILEAEMDGLQKGINNHA